MPGGADLIRLRKVPVELDGRPNPLALLDDAGPCSLNGNIVTTDEDYDAWRFTLEKTVRKELERSWRVFTRDPAAGFSLVTDHHEALRILSATEVQQGTRMQSLGLTSFSTTKPVPRSTAIWSAMASAAVTRWYRRLRSATKSWRRCSAFAAARATS